MPSWRDVWEQRGREFPGNDIIEIDGFDYGLGKMDPQKVEFLLNKIKSAMVLTREDLLLEAGCGAGMLLKPLSFHVRKVVGVDYAASMARRCKANVPGAEIVTAEIGKLPFRDNTFDKIVCFSVFEYLPSLGYAKQTVAEFFRTCKPHGRIFIGDVPDENKKLEYIESRRKISEKPRWKSSYDIVTEHLWFKREFFYGIAKEQNAKCCISQQDIPGYGNSPYRFNVFFEL